MSAAMVNPKSRILVVDDHPIVVEGYRVLINRHRDLEVCGVASSALEALNKAKLVRPHLIVVDLVLKDSDGLDLIKDFHVRFPEMKLLVVSARDECVFAERALHAGAGGYVNKEATGKLIDAIRDVLGGKIYLSPEMTDRIFAPGNVERRLAAFPGRSTCRPRIGGVRTDRPRPDHSGNRFPNAHQPQDRGPLPGKH
jgi:DNA-binding NarL/FixJ family response regulator